MADQAEPDNQLLARALTKIETVVLSASFGFGMTTSHTTAIFRAILTQEEVNLENLTLKFHDLREVDGELLAAAVTSLKTVNLDYTQLPCT